MTLQPFAVAPVMGLLAATPVAGFALANGTPTLVSWTAPADGQQHRFMVTGNTVIGSAETGGAVHVTWTTPGSGATSAGTDPGGTAGPGVKNWTLTMGVVAPGTTVTVSQSSALTLGAATSYAEIWGS